MFLNDVQPFVEKIANTGPANAWTIIINTDPHWCAIAIHRYPWVVVTHE